MGNRRNPSSPKSQRCHRPDASPPPPPRARRFAAFVGRFNASAFALLLSKSNTFPQTGHVLQLFLPQAPGEGSRGGGVRVPGAPLGVPTGAEKCALPPLPPPEPDTDARLCPISLDLFGERGLKPILIPIHLGADFLLCSASGLPGIWTPPRNPSVCGAAACPHVPQRQGLAGAGAGRRCVCSDRGLSWNQPSLTQQLPGGQNAPSMNLHGPDGAGGVR